MKKTRKWISLLCAMVMVFLLAAPAGAASVQPTTKAIISNICAEQLPEETREEEFSLLFPGGPSW